MLLFFFGLFVDHNICFSTLSASFSSLFFVRLASDGGWGDVCVGGRMLQNKNPAQLLEPRDMFDLSLQNTEREKSGRRGGECFLRAAARAPWWRIMPLAFCTAVHGTSGLPSNALEIFSLFFLLPARDYVECEGDKHRGLQNLCTASKRRCGNQGGYQHTFKCSVREKL